MRAYNEELITAEQYFQELRAIKAEREALGIAREREEVRQLRERNVITSEDAWEQASTTERNLTMRAVFGRAYVKPATRLGPTVDYSRVVWRYRTQKDWEQELAEALAQ